MNCKACESILAEYALGELADDEAALCRAHLEACPACREALAAYTCLIGVIAHEPAAAPTQAEGAAMARALDGVDPHRVPARRTAEPALQGLPAFLAACAAAFVIVAGFAIAVAFRVMSIPVPVGVTGWAGVGIAVTVVVFLTSFVPIAVTARRRPLNGMTFRR